MTMAYRLVGQRVFKLASTAPRMAMLSTAPVAPAASNSSAPTVMDMCITLNFVDPSGARRKVPGLVGMYVETVIGASIA